MRTHQKRTEAGSTTVIVVIGVVAILALVAGLLVFSKHKDNDSTSVAHSEKGIQRDVSYGRTKQAL